jgi:lipopolysaccharide/colanic/teichoic acid biosynthesis glycosyltransferase
LSAALALGPCLPVISVAGLVIRVLSGRSPLVAHRRVGLNGEQFWMLKLRTMWDGRATGHDPLLIEYLDGPPIPVSKRGRDPRVTSRFAALCRKFSIDELPQLIHIVAGRMSFVGPRPLTPEELETHYGESASEVLQASPGITGLWQVLGRNRLTYRQRRRLDLFFVRKRCFALSAWILLRTPARVLSGRDSL